MPVAAATWYVAKRLPRPLLAASAAGWLVLAGQAAVPSLSALCLSATSVREALIGPLEAMLAIASPSALALGWLTMILAMMSPLLGSPLRHVWRRSLTRRRIRAALLFLLGYAGVWLAAGALLVPGSLVLAGVAPTTGMPAVALAALIALAWQSTPLKQMALNRCHRRPPLAAFGFRAEADALRFGAGHGVWCVGSCWGWMLLALATDGPLHWAAMATVTVLSIVESARAPGIERWGAAWPHLPQPLHSLPRPGRTAA